MVSLLFIFALSKLSYGQDKKEFILGGSELLANYLLQAYYPMNAAYDESEGMVILKIRITIYNELGQQDECDKITFLKEQIANLEMIN